MLWVFDVDHVHLSRGNAGCIQEADIEMDLWPDKRWKGMEDDTI
jgi:hypothetical protein